MTTYEAYEAVGRWLVATAERRRRRPVNRTTVQAVWNLVTVVAGLVLLSAAAWLVCVPLGVAIAGVSCLVLGKAVSWDASP